MAAGCLESLGYLGGGITESREEEEEDNFQAYDSESAKQASPSHSPFCPSSPVLWDTAVLQERSQEGKAEMTVELVKAISQVSYFLSHPRKAVLFFRI